MTSAVRLAVSGLLRAPGRSLIRILVLAASVALLGGMLLFVGNSLRTVAGSAVRSVPLDLQGPVSSYGQARTVAGEVARQSGVLQASAAATAPLTGAEHQGRTASPAREPERCSPCRSTIAPTSAPSACCRARCARGGRARPADGGHAPGPHRRPGDATRTRRRAAADLSGLRRRAGHGARPALPAAEPAARPGAAQPPANIAIMPLDTFASTLARQLPTVGAAGPGANVSRERRPACSGRCRRSSTPWP